MIKAKDRNNHKIVLALAKMHITIAHDNYRHTTMASAEEYYIDSR